jgi:O-antigen/teichoic acid export membrane protein
MPSSLANTGGSQAPIFFMTRYFVDTMVGSFSFAARILAAPSAVISMSVGQVFFRTISESKNSGRDNMTRVFLNTGKGLFLISICVFTPVFLFGETIFRNVFGNAWGDAGKYAEILAVGLFIKFIASPLSVVFLVMDKLKYLACWQFIYLSAIISCFFFSRNDEPFTIMWRYVSVDAVMYISYLVLMYRVIKRDVSKID